MAGYAREDILPDQQALMKWCELNLHLTRRWYGGSGNLSAMYGFFCHCSDFTSPYTWEMLAPVRSEDGWIRAIDAKLRKSFYGGGSKASEEETVAKVGVRSPRPSLGNG